MLTRSRQCYFFLSLLFVVCATMGGGTMLFAQPVDFLVFDRFYGTVYRITAQGDAGEWTIERVATINNVNDDSEDWVMPLPDEQVAVATIEGWSKKYGMERIPRVRVMGKRSDGNWSASCKLRFSEQIDRELIYDSPSKIFDFLSELPDYAPNLDGIWFDVPDREFVTLIESVNTDDWDRAERISDGLLEQYPDSPLFRLTALDVAAKRRKADKVLALLEKYREEMKSSPDKFLPVVPEFYDQWLVAWGAAQEGRNVIESGREVFWPDIDPTTLPSTQNVQSYLSTVQYGDSATPLDDLLVLRNPVAVTSFLHVQVHAKLAKIRADFYLMMGFPDKALAEIEGIQRFSTVLMKSSPNTIDDLIGIAISSMLSNSGELIFLNGFQSYEEVRDHWPRLDIMYREMKAAAHEPKTWQGREDRFFPVSTCYPFNYIEANTRNRVAETRWALLHSATAARYMMLRTGEYPKDTQNFGLLLPEGADPDPFALAGERLRIEPRHEKGWTLYSVGPDQEDGNAAVAYDPTNGTVSAGDVMIHVPRERAYPFPNPDDVPETRAEIVSRYPNGLPDDPFSGWRKDEYSGGQRCSYIISDTKPAVVWSVGPDRDFDEWHLGGGLVSMKSNMPRDMGISRLSSGELLLMENTPGEVVYDPTNGITSVGNLYMIMRNAGD